MPNETTFDDAEAGSEGPGVVRLFAGMVIAPLAWSLQVLIGYGLSAYACYPKVTSLAAPVWPDVRAIVGGITIALWVLLLAGCAIAWINWKATEAQADKSSGEIMHTGDGRPRFMALCGIVVSGTFAVVLVFTSVGILWVPTCGP